MTTYRFARSATGILSGDGSVAMPFLVQAGSQGSTQITTWETGINAVFAAICGTAAPTYAEVVSGLGGPSGEQGPSEYQNIEVYQQGVAEAVRAAVNIKASQLHNIVARRQDFTSQVSPATYESPVATVWSKDPAAMVAEYGDGHSNNRTWGFESLMELSRST